MTEVATGEITLIWDVFVKPGIPTVSSDPASGMKQLMSSPRSSTLISGKRDSVLVDTFITVEQADILVDWVAASGKNLTTIYVTHGHGDHFFGIGALLDRLPNAGAVATSDAVKHMRQQASSIRGERSGFRRARSNLKLFRTKGVFLCGSCNS
jgi:glyoxylase-like metal-dependent hydrolase (beta-lactamase superfamily II)